MMPQRGSWHSSPPLISPPLLIILLPIFVLTLLFLAVPPLFSAANNVLRPASVKTGWDSLNILLVVFAILFGVFARRNDDEPSSNDSVPDQNDADHRVSSEGGGTGGGFESQQWFGFSEEKKVYDATPNRVQSPVTGVTRLRRSSSSYPDLRQWETGNDGCKFRFFDDYEIDKHFRSPAREQFPAVDNRKRWPEDRRQEEEDEGEVRVKEIPVDTFEIRPSPPVKSPAPNPPPAPPPPPPPPPVSVRHPPIRMHLNVESVSEITELDDPESTRIQSPPPAPPTPPSPRPSAKIRSEQKHGKSEHRKSTVKREIAMVWASVLSNQRKRKKKQRTKGDHNHNHNYDNVDELTNSATAPATPPPPTPPPPLPPPSVFHSLFRKGLGKSEKIHSVSTPPPPPPPPLTSSRRWSKRKNQVPPPPPRRGNTGKPPLPNKTGNIIDETINAGNQSPLIPPPPPPPPFKMPAMKFSVRGDFVKIRSNQSSLCSSPEREHIDVEVSETTTTTTLTAATVTTVNDAVMDRNGDVSGSVFCPSPDVNVKAATFIARLRGEWRLEKLNSIKEKGNASLPLARDYTL